MTQNNILLRVGKLLKEVSNIKVELNELFIMLAKRENITMSEFTLNCDTCTVDNGSKIIELTNTEFEILYFVASNMPNMTKSQSIFEYLYPDEKYLPSLDRGLSVHICNANKKISRLIRRKVIQYRRGVGYYINEKIY